MSRTLRGRVALFALGITACWLAVLTVALNVLVAAATTDNERAERLTLVGSVAVAALLLLGLYPVLRLTVRRALNPVETMTHDAAEWSIHDPGRRFGTKQQLAEISSLAASLDVMLERVTALLRHERTVSADLSHELRTPLTTLLAETELLAGSPLSGEDARCVDGIRSSAFTMQRIVDSLLTSARITHAESLGRARVCDIVRGAAATVQQRSAMRLSVEPDDLNAGVDQHLGERILSPVLANAMRFATTNVEVRARRESGRVQIDIGNDGPTILAEEREAIFLPGVTSTMTDAAHAGAGLGLPLARRLARAAEGEVTLLSHDPVVFRVELPM